MLAAIYRKIVSEELRRNIYSAFLGNVLYRYRLLKGSLYCKWCLLYYSIVSPKNEIEQVYKDWGIAGFSPYPYTWKREYDNQQYQTNIDSNNGLSYLFHNGKRLYFRRDMTRSTIENIYKGLLIEQDKRSAHRYVDSYEELHGKTLCDIGTAEGIFALDVIEYVNHIYLFECEEAWVEALEATFAPWKDKITIVRKYVSDIDDDQNITLDTYFKDRLFDHLFLKMDIEGYERKALKGAKNILDSSKYIAGAVCIYHLHDDELVIRDILSLANLSLINVPGYLYMQGTMRHGVIRFRR